jgi:hypothetical protein
MSTREELEAAQARSRKLSEGEYVHIRVSERVGAVLGGRDLILIGGAITTPERFERFIDSLAHSYPEDDTISCYGHQIGTNADIELVP